MEQTTNLILVAIAQDTSLVELDLTMALFVGGGDVPTNQY